MVAVVLTLVAVLLVALTAHEAAHALALRRMGIPISHAGVGLPFPPMLKIGPRGRLPITLTFSPWLVGAYVRPDERHQRRVDALPYSDLAWYLNAGIIVNLVTGFGALALATGAAGDLFTAAGLAGVAVGTWFARRPLAAYVIPAAAPLALAAVIAGLVVSWRQGDTGVGYAGLFELVPTGSLQGVVEFFGVTSVALAVVNAIPLFGLDNSKVVLVLLKRWTSPRVVAAYQYAGLTLLVSLLLLGVVSDIWAAGKAAIGALVD